MSLPPVVIYNKAVKAAHKMVGTGITDNFQLEEAGKELFGKEWAGVGSANDLPKLTDEKCKAIFNLDKEGNPGTHWCGLYKKDNTIYMFDSFSRSLLKDRAFENMRSLSRKVMKQANINGPNQKVKQLDCGARSLGFLMCCGKMSIPNLMKI
jgi:hypothetical protein